MIRTLLLPAAVTGLLMIAAPLLAQEPRDGEPKTSQVPETLVEKASYVMGRGIIDDFRAQQVEFDLVQLLQGIRDAADGTPSRLSAEDSKAVLESFGREVEKRQQERFAKVADRNMRQSEQFLQKNALQENVIQLESGLQYRVLQEGAGRKPVLADRVKIAYTGKTLDDKIFEATKPGEPIEVVVGAVPIRGLMDALPRMPVGSKWEIVIPPQLAYGVSGAPPAIEPNQVLILEVDLLSIEDK